MGKKKVVIIAVVGIVAYILTMGIISFAQVKLNKKDPATSSLIVATKYLQASNIDDYVDYLESCKKYMSDDMYSESLSYPSWISTDTRVTSNEVVKTGYWSGNNYVFANAEEVFKYFNLKDSKQIVDNQTIYDETYSEDSAQGRYHIYSMNVTIGNTTTYPFFVTLLTDTQGKVESIYIKSSEKV